LRAADLPPIANWEVAHDSIVKPPKGTTHVVLDTPAGLHGKKLSEVVKLASKIIVPLQPSIFDIYATTTFVEQLRHLRGADKADIAVVGMRIKEGTIAADQLRTYVHGLGLPVLGFLRDTQNYIHLAARGLTLWDVKPASRVEKDLAQWAPICRWIDA